MVPSIAVHPEPHLLPVPRPGGTGGVGAHTGRSLRAIFPAPSEFSRLPVDEPGSTAALRRDGVTVVVRVAFVASVAVDRREDDQRQDKYSDSRAHRK